MQDRKISVIIYIYIMNRLARPGTVRRYGTPVENRIYIFCGRLIFWGIFAPRPPPIPLSPIHYVSNANRIGGRVFSWLPFHSFHNKEFHEKSSMFFMFKSISEIGKGCKSTIQEERYTLSPRYLTIIFRENWRDMCSKDWCMAEWSEDLSRWVNDQICWSSSSFHHDHHYHYHYHHHYIPSSSSTASSLSRSSVSSIFYIEWWYANSTISMIITITMSQRQ